MTSQGVPATITAAGLEEALAAHRAQADDTYATPDAVAAAVEASEQTASGLYVPARYARRRELPSRAALKELATSPTISTAQTTTPTSGYVKHAPPGITLSGTDVTFPYTWLGCTDVIAGTGSPDSNYVLPTSKHPHTYATPQSAWGFTVVTDATAVQLRFKHISSSTRWRLHIDGKPVQEAAVSTGGTGVGAGHLLTIDFGSAAPEGRTLRFDLFTVPFGGLYLPPTARLWQPEPLGDALAGFGDSITDGSSENSGQGIGTWLYRLGRMLGCESVWDQAKGATGYVAVGTSANFVDRVQPDVVAYGLRRGVVWAGYNDAAQSQATIAANADTVFEALQDIPGADWVVGGCWSPSGSPSAGLTNTDATLRQAAADAELPFVSTITGDIYDAAGDQVAAQGAWITGTGKSGATTGSGNADWTIGTDGVHLTEDGHRYVADRWYRAHRALMAA